MIEQTAQNEYGLLKEKMVKTGSPLGFFNRWRWRTRQKQLLKALAGLAEKIKTLERQIEFVDIPRARNKKWKP